VRARSARARASVPGSLAAAQATEVNAQLQYSRALELVKNQNISVATVDQNRANLDGAKATVLQTQAALTQAAVNLSYTDIKAPVDGRIGLTAYTEGNLVNAASGVLKPAMDMSLKHWRWCLETNAFALNLLAQRAAPLMRDGGRIIAMSSLGAQRAMPDYGFIGASKAALESLVRTLAQELGPKGIRVNTVSAGVVDTDALQHFPNREQLLANFAQRTPAGPVLTPEDVAGAVYLLCLPEAAMITGHTLVVDGGFCISG